MRNLYRELVLRWARRPSFVAFGRFVVRPVDVASRRLGLVRLLGRPLSAVGTGLEVAYLTTTGRRSGHPRTTPLVPIDLPAGVALIASNWGQDTRPNWFLNLSADPDCVLERGRERRPYRARPADRDERRLIWDRALEVYPAWQAYDARVSRELDMVVLEPREPS